MKSLFVGLVALIGMMPFAFAQDLNFSEYRKFLMNGNQQNSGKKFAVQTTCTTGSGQTYRVGESGYDTCLASLKSSESRQKTDSKNSHQSDAAPGATTTIHFGN